MLPTVNRTGRASSGGYRNNSVLPQYLRRIVKYQQMDMEYTFWQMLHLCTSPKVVYQQTKYHKQTKNQWARDDPAFVVICSFLLAVAASAFSAAYGHGVAQATFTIASVVIMHFLLAGISLASICWFLSNHYLREEIAVHTHVVEQRVEWLYAFDIHCNAYFPLFVVLYVLQYFLSPLLLVHGFMSTLLSNVLYFVAISYYHYLNFLGYDVPTMASFQNLCVVLLCQPLLTVNDVMSPFWANFSRYSGVFLSTVVAVLPFLERTTFFLYPIFLLALLFPISLLSGFNPTRFALGLYFG